MGSTFSQPEWESGKNENSPLQVRKVSAENRKNLQGRRGGIIKAKSTQEPCTFSVSTGATEREQRDLRTIPDAGWHLGNKNWAHRLTWPRTDHATSGPCSSLQE